MLALDASPERDRPVLMKEVLEIPSASVSLERLHEIVTLDVSGGANRITGETAHPNGGAVHDQIEFALAEPK